MKKLVLLAFLHWGATLAVSAGSYNFSFSSGFDNGGVVQDGNLNPWSDTRTLSGIAETQILNLNVSLSIIGGCNGDLYCYLSYDGTLVPLLNRVGVSSTNAFGYDDAGLNVTFTDQATLNIHWYQTITNFSISAGTSYQPDGRNVSPILAVPSDFDAEGTVPLATFSGKNPNGEWTLVVSDVSGGGGDPTVLSWGLDIITVPEPTMGALAALGGLFLFARSKVSARIGISGGISGVARAK